MNSMLSDGDFQTSFNAWRDEAEGIDLVQFLNGSRGGKLKKQGAEFVGPCPRCGGTDRFSINTQERVFNCRGFGGGSYIDAIMHVDDCDFLSACEAMTGRPAPERPKRQKGERRAASAAPKQEQTQAKPDTSPAPSAPVSDERQERRARARVADLYDDGKPIKGTHAAAYFEARGLAVYDGWTFDMRFVASLPYLGYSSPDAEEQTNLGDFPALLCAIRSLRGDIIGVHRTYLDPKLPRKLTPPGDTRRNSAKKIVGKVKFGAIRLSAPSPLLVVGEGTETTRSAAILGIGGGDAGYWSAISLGNLAGGCTGSLPHPTIEKRSIPNGVPDMEKPGIALPDEVEEVIILGDGDSDKPTTYAYLLAAGRRWQEQGRKVFYANAPDGRDWNDVLQEGAGQ